MTYMVLVAGPYRFVGPVADEPIGPLHLVRQDAGAPFVTECQARIPVNAVRLYTVAPGDRLCTPCRDAGQRAGTLLEFPD